MNDKTNMNEDELNKRHAIKMLKKKEARKKILATNVLIGNQEIFPKDMIINIYILMQAII